MIQLFQKEKSTWTKDDVKTISTILFRNYRFFLNLKESLSEKNIHDIITMINIETFNINDRIVKFGKYIRYNFINHYQTKLNIIK